MALTGRVHRQDTGEQRRAVFPDIEKKAGEGERLAIPQDTIDPWVDILTAVDLLIEPSLQRHQHAMVVLATRNAHKVDELGRILAPYEIELLSLDDAGVTGEVIETGATFADNALLKARAAAADSGLPAVADDSGDRTPSDGQVSERPRAPRAPSAARPADASQAARRSRPRPAAAGEQAVPHRRVAGARPPEGGRRD